MSVGSYLDSSRRLGLLAGRHRRRMSRRCPLMPAGSGGTMAPSGSATQKMDWWRDGRALRRQAERQLTGDIRTRLLYVAITSPTRAGSLPPRFEPCHFSDFLKRSFSSNEKAELELQLAHLNRPTLQLLSVFCQCSAHQYCIHYNTTSWASVLLRTFLSFICSTTVHLNSKSYCAATLLQ